MNAPRRPRSLRGTPGSLTGGIDPAAEAEEIRHAARQSLAGPESRAATERLLGLLYEVLDRSIERTVRNLSDWADRVGEVESDNLACAAMNDVLDRVAGNPSLRKALAEASNPVAYAAAVARKATIDAFRRLPDKEPHYGIELDVADESENGDECTDDEYRRPKMGSHDETPHEVPEQSLPLGQPILEREHRAHKARKALEALPTPVRVVYLLATSPECRLSDGDVAWIAEKRGIAPGQVLDEIEARQDRVVERVERVRRSLERRAARIHGLLEQLGRARNAAKRLGGSRKPVTMPSPEQLRSFRRASGLQKAKPDELRGWLQWLEDRLEELLRRQKEEHRAMTATPGEEGAMQVDFYEIAELIGELSPGADAKARKDAHNRVSYLFRKARKLVALTIGDDEETDDD